MLTPARGLALSIQSAEPLPRVEALTALYNLGCTPRRGEVIMVVGRSGTQKSGFALWYTAQMNQRTLYLSGDMSLFQASVRLACSVMGLTTEEIEERMAAGGRKRQEVEDALAKLNFTISAGPISWAGIDAELEAYVELHDCFPETIVVDNLMDIEGAESDYTAQMEAMQNITALARATGATIFVLHRASDKSWDARTDPWAPPSRDQVKNGMAEKPELCLAVGLDPTSGQYRIAVLKQRMGKCDPTGRTTASFLCLPSMTQFAVWTPPVYESAPTFRTIGSN